MEEQPEQYEEQPQMPYGAPFQQNNGNMIYMTNPEEELDKLEANFRGQVLNAKGEYENKFNPVMSDKGVNKVMGMVRAVVNRVTFMSNIDEKRLNSFVEHFADTLIVVLMENKHDFRIKTDGDRTSIFYQAVTLAHIAALRGLQEGDKRFWKGTSQEIIYGGGNNGARKESGILGKITPGGWFN